MHCSIKIKLNVSVELQYSSDEKQTIKLIALSPLVNGQEHWAISLAYDYQN